MESTKKSNKKHRERVYKLLLEDCAAIDKSFKEAVASGELDDVKILVDRELILEKARDEEPEPNPMELIGRAQRQQMIMKLCRGLKNPTDTCVSTTFFSAIITKDMYDHIYALERTDGNPPDYEVEFLWLQDW